MVTFSIAQGWKITFTTLLESFYGRQFTARLASHFSPDRAHGLATGALLLEDFGLDYIKGDDFFLQNTEQELDSFGSLERIL